MKEKTKFEFQKLEDLARNMVEVHIYTEHGCDVTEWGYSLEISSFTGSLDISSYGGGDDISLIKDCIENSLGSELDLPSEGLTQVVLKESGEWEGYSWHKYYVIDSVIYLD